MRKQTLKKLPKLRKTVSTYVLNQTGQMVYLRNESNLNLTIKGLHSLHVSHLTRERKIKEDLKISLYTKTVELLNRKSKNPKIVAHKHNKQNNKFFYFTS